MILMKVHPIQMKLPLSLQLLNLGIKLEKMLRVILSKYWKSVINLETMIWWI